MGVEEGMGWAGLSGKKGSLVYGKVGLRKLKEIEKCKEAHIAANPHRYAAEATLPPPARAQPTRVQPARERETVRRFMFHVSQLDDSDDRWLVSHGFRLLRRSIRERCAALAWRTPSPNGYVLAADYN